MYIIYIDESGMSQGTTPDPQQPVIVVGGILINIEQRLRKALAVFDRIMGQINNVPEGKKVNELKWSDFKSNKFPYRETIGGVEERADYLESIIDYFRNEIKFKVIYCAINVHDFNSVKKNSPLIREQLYHPYLAASYKVIATTDKYQDDSERKKYNKSKTFYIFDEQSRYQAKLEELCIRPPQTQGFKHINDTSYFGKSQYSRLLQIADLFVGAIRYYHQSNYFGTNTGYLFQRVEEIVQKLNNDRITNSNSLPIDIENLYKGFEL